jgi:CHASE3 domain sensor protein
MWRGVENYPHIVEYLTMKKRLFFINAAFILSLIIILILSYLLYRSYAASNDYNYRIEHAYKVSLQTSELENFLKEAETGHRGYLLTNDSAFLEPYFRIRNDIKPSYDSLKMLTSGNTTQQQLLNKAGLLINNLIDHSQQSIRAINLQKTRSNLIVGKSIMDSLRKVFKQVQHEEMQLVQVISADKIFYQSSMPRYFVAIFLFAFVVFLISFLVILKEFRQRSLYQKQL